MSVFDLSDPASLKDEIWFSLHLRRGDFYQNPERGSDLHTLRRGKATTATTGKAESMAKRALQWLLDAGRITSLLVSAAFVEPQKLQLSIRAVGADGEPVELTTFVPVGVLS